MLGLLLTLMFGDLVLIAMRGFARKWLEALHPLEQVGVAGIFGLGLVGTLTLLAGVINLTLAFAMVGVLVVVGVALAVKQGFFRELMEADFQFGSPWVWAGIGGLLLFPLVGVLVPSTTLDWDSLAYHLAVPKLWLQAGQIDYIQGIHHSNFPFAVGNLYLYGLSWGGESGAKAFSWLFLAYGICAVAGLVNRVHGKGGEWAALALAASPVVLWEAGTAYIDVAHGLFGGLGLWYLAEAVWRRTREEEAAPWWILGGLGLGLAAGSKLTGLQMLAAAGLVAAIFGLKHARLTWRPAAGAMLLALVLAAPWLGKSSVMTGNPVFPFFYEVFGGRDWDQWRADVYRNEQQTFGVGRTESGRDWSQVGHAVLGLAYQPGRYVNPGQQVGAGFPTGAVGALAMITLVVWGLAGLRGRPQLGREAMVLAACGVLLLMWFVLSQQSRYLTLMVVPSCLLFGAALAHLSSARLLQGVAALQAIAVAVMLWVFQTANQLPVALGQVPVQEFRERSIAFAPAAAAINQNEAVKKVALYDEVFGFLLDRPYFWANPGHSRKIPYQDLNDGLAYARTMRELGFTHVYINLQFMPAPDRERWAQMPAIPITEPISDNLDLRWRWLLEDAIRQGVVGNVQPFRSGLLLEIAAESQNVN